MNEKNINKFDTNIMELLRIEKGLIKTDMSQDDIINSYSVNEAYKKLLLFGNYSDFNIKIRQEFLDNLKNENY